MLVVSYTNLDCFEGETQFSATAAVEDTRKHRLQLWVSYETNRFREVHTNEDGTFDRFVEWEWCVVHGHPCRVRVGTGSYDSETQCKTPSYSDLRGSTKCSMEPRSVDTME